MTNPLSFRFALLPPLKRQRKRLCRAKRRSEIYENEAYPKIWALLEPFVVKHSDAKLYEVETSIRQQVLAVAA